VKRRLILHLGIAKTGTTTIQRFLRENPDILAAAGIVYPRLGVDLTNHPAFRRSAFTSYLQKEANHVALALEIQRKRDTTEAVFDTPLWSTAFRRIDESGARTAIVSYENFAMRVESYRFDALAPRLREYDVCGVVCLRAQEDWVTSLYGQVIRGRDRLAVPLADFDVFRGLGRLGFSTRLDAVSRRLPLDDLVVSDFSQAARSGLLADFMDRTGLPRDQLLPADEPRPRNVSLPSWANLFLLRCNQGGLPDGPFVEVLAGLKRLARRAEVIPDLAPGLDIATPEERAALRGVMAADADRLMERYGIALDPKVREPAPYRPFEASDFRAIRAALAARLSKATREALERI
jgi:hypothetical protein